ncbi:glycine betaine ABC transporter substrate-binding protein [Nocardia donostiensis]|uniref:Transporter n=1 Tax=Nocardia donostiensis TaxID=1538463 RepID=A0A1W0B8S2_9NOCA|nr:glycine betaine ABC transporter substrate-binding protein [Nocardia donostiensis]ONM50687.1 transporter [Nocardia donostiensis]OQS17085.1 transporter [Nocardia donostiensis]OQS18909.1 transporter [Nocardia donostiensis]
MVLAASRRMLARVLVAAAAALAVSCGSDDAPAPVVVGAGDSAESRVLAEVYAQALARTGIVTAVRPDLGGRADYLAVLDAAEVTLVGEHNGALLAALGADSEDGTVDKVTEALYGSLPPGLVVSDAADGTDLRPRVVLTDAAAGQYRIGSIDDLLPHCPAFTVAVAPVSGLLTLPAPAADIDGCEFAATLTLPDAGELRRALTEGRAQAGVLTGPAELMPGGGAGLTVLSDDEYALPAQNVLALVRKNVLGERQWEKLNYVAGELTTDELLTMVRRVRDDAADPAELARTWLDAHGL